jgi:hypothetical protein
MPYVGNCCIYFKELVRYIHLNPLRAKLDRYRWCGHSVLMGRPARIAWALAMVGRSQLAEKLIERSS